MEVERNTSIKSPRKRFKDMAYGECFDLYDDDQFGKGKFVKVMIHKNFAARILGVDGGFDSNTDWVQVGLDIHKDIICFVDQDTDIEYRIIQGKFVYN